MNLRKPCKKTGSARLERGYGRCRRRRTGLVLLMALLGAGLFGAGVEPAWAQKPQANPSGFPIPRFVSLKSNPVNLRKGPGRQYPKAWIFRRAGLPVEVIQEFELWRRVRDSEGASGWVYHSLLSGRRTALVLPWELKKGAAAALTDLRTSARRSASVIARLEAGTLAAVQSCSRLWCRVTVGRFRGYVAKERLWGVYPDETIK